MRLKEEDLWNSVSDIILVSGNSFIKRDGSIVMGVGAAREMNLYSNIYLINYSLGRLVEKMCGHLGIYGIVYTSNGHNTYGLFQVKYHWKDDASLGLIKYSTALLELLLERDFNNKTVSMNFPGVGYGNLNSEDVLPIINTLPDSVTIYHKGNI